MDVNEFIANLEAMAGPLPSGGTGSDWRSHTCGDCGWAHCFKGQNGSELFICRKNAWMSGDQWGLPMPACPAFVVREVKHAAIIAAGKE